MEMLDFKESLFQSEHFFVIARHLLKAEHFNQNSESESQLRGSLLCGSLPFRYHGCKLVRRYLHTTFRPFGTLILFYTPPLLYVSSFRILVVLTNYTGFELQELTLKRSSRLKIHFKAKFIQRLKSNLKEKLIQRRITNLKEKFIHHLRPNLKEKFI